MNIKGSCKLTELYASCPECGCDLIGNGKGTLECDTEAGFFKRTCACGWSVTVREQSLRIKSLPRYLEASAPDQLDLNRENMGQSLLIRQLETELHEVKSELNEERYRHDRLQDFEVAESQQLARIKAERDAAVAQLKEYHCCKACVHNDYDPDCGEDCLECTAGCPCRNCIDSSLFEWRGLGGATRWND